MPGHEADVLIWGARHFLRRDGKYYECFAVAALTREEQLGAEQEFDCDD